MRIFDMDVFLQYLNAWFELSFVQLPSIPGIGYIWDLICWMKEPKQQSEKIVARGQKEFAIARVSTKSASVLAAKLQYYQSALGCSFMGAVLVRLN